MASKAQNILKGDGFQEKVNEIPMSKESKPLSKTNIQKQPTKKRNDNSRQKQEK